MPASAGLGSRGGSRSWGDWRWACGGHGRRCWDGPSRGRRAGRTRRRQPGRGGRGVRDDRHLDGRARRAGRRQGGQGRAEAAHRLARRRGRAPLRRQRPRGTSWPTGRSRGPRCWSTAPPVPSARWRCSWPRWPEPRSPRVCGPTNADLVRRLGAQEVIDHTTTRCWTDDERYDVVLDDGRQPRRRPGRRLLAPGGTLLLVAANLADTVRARGDAVAGTGCRGSGAHDGAARPRRRGRPGGRSSTARCRSTEIVEAYRVVDSGHKVGNLVVTP